MANPFVAEIRIFPFNFAPTGWATCDGQLMPLSQNTALFSLLGTYYGGDGLNTFALPNFQGSAAIGQGQALGFSEYFLGQSSGSETTTLINSEMPSHNHIASGKLPGLAPNNPVANPANTTTWGAVGTQRPPPNFYATAAGTPVLMNVGALTTAGGSSPHNNLMPYLMMNFCIALQGLYPPRQ